VRVYFLALQTALVMATVPACDGYTYKGRDGAESLALAKNMSLPDAYLFYIETYRGTHPPMLDVAETFRRFGAQGTRYLAEKALATYDSGEFDAVMDALLVLDYSCPAALSKALITKRKQLRAAASVRLACDSAISLNPDIRK
jgi:hypothetical protein